ncbi:MAG TPA: AI-2E family transporter [Bryobacteraceae bacterium]|nr:AI-2E family transporter [Bryobacteraceae bacterium]
MGPEHSRHGSELSTFASLATIGLVICGLYFGKEVLVPFALALLLTFLLTPPVTWLEKLKFGRAPSVVLVLTLAVATASGILWVAATQVTEVASNLPHYQRNIQKKIAAMRNPAGHSLERARQNIEQLRRELAGKAASDEKAKERPSTKAAGGAHSVTTRVTPPVPVEIVNPPSSVDLLDSLGAPLVRFLEQAGAVLIFALFMLMQRADLRNRLFRLFGSGNLNTTTTAMDDAAQRVSRYLFTQMIVNGSFGFLLGLGLHFVGVPNAPFWGVLGAILRFIPYVGTLIAGLCPLVLALAVFEGWARPLLTFGVYATIELTISVAIEPWLYGAHTGISALAILVSAAFWTLLWGPIGLVISTPMTVCLVVLGRYVPPLKFLGVLLGDEPVLPPEACYYQRLLALNEEDAQEVAETYLKEQGLLQLYDCMLLPALSLAERDRHEHALEEDRERLIYQTTKDLINELSEQTAYLPLKERFSILCVPARDEADELAGLMLVHILRQAGFPSDAIAAGNGEAMIKSIEERAPDVLFISALPPSTIGQARSLCRNVRHRFPSLKIVVGFWDPTAEVGKVHERLGAQYVDKVVTTLGEAEAQMKRYAGSGEVQENATLSGLHDTPLVVS